MKRSRFSPLLLGLLLLPFAALRVYGILQNKNIRVLDTFTDASRYIFLTATLLLFLGTVWGCFTNAPAGEGRPVKMHVFWTAGFVAVMVFALGAVYFVNPHARFGGDLNSAITPNARSVKTNALRGQSAPPAIVIFGSSRAFSLSPQYIEKKTGYSAYNLSVEGGRVGDFTVQLNFMLKSGMSPRVLVIDVSQETLSSGYQNLDLQPLALIPYMPAPMGFAVAENVLKDVASVQSLSDSVYLLTIARTQNRTRTWVFQKDGMGIRKQITHEQYVDLLRSTIGTRIDGMQCKKFDPSAMAAFEEVIRLAQENNIAVILYESPIHSEFYQAARDDNPQAFAACRDLLSGYLQSLADQYPNTSYTDLLFYQPVSGLGEEGYYDAVHLRPNAAELVVDALMSDIESAMAWSSRGYSK